MRWWKGLVCGGLGLVAVLAGPGAASAEDLEQCLWTVSERYRVNPFVLRAIIEVESRGHPWAVGYRADRRVHSVYPATREDAERLVRDLWRRRIPFDIGLGQINHRHLREWAVEDPAVLLDPCTNLHWAAYILRQKMDRYGNTWTAIERYNGINPRYPEKVRNVLQEWEVWP